MVENDRFVFISYPREDQGFVKELVDFMEAKGIKVYIDYKDIQPGTLFAKEIVTAIKSALCCVLVFTGNSNESHFVMCEMNSAVNHNKPIIPLRIDRVLPSENLELYIGPYNWIEYTDATSLETLIKAINAIRTPKQKSSEIKCKGPVVLRSEGLSEIGYSTKRKVIETIEIDYITVRKASNEYTLDEKTEGTVLDWIEYAKSYPETSSMLVVNDRIVGYYQMELINYENYNDVVSGQKMIHSSMEEFYGFGGEFYCYIAVMPIIQEYETQKNYLLLLNDFLKKMVEFSNDGISILKYAISVYTPLLEMMMKSFGFEVVGTNPVGGKIMELTKEKIVNLTLIRDRYPEFYNIYAKQ